jgi:hypothetical protein
MAAFAMPAAAVVPITPMAWRRDVIGLGEPVLSAPIVSSSGIITELPVDRLQGSRSRPIEAEGPAAGKFPRFGPPKARELCHPAAIIRLNRATGDICDRRANGRLE